MKSRARVKTPLVLQMENTDCGAVALGIVLAFYGCHVPIKELREQCEVSRDGVSVVGLVKAAQQYNLLTRTSKECLVPEAFNFPWILFWNRKHFVVLEGIKGKNVYINDPSKGRRTIDHTALIQGFSGIVIHLTPNKSFKQRAKEKQYQAYFSWLKKKWVSFSALCVLTCLVTLLNLAPPIFSQHFIDHYAARTSSDTGSLFVGIAFALMMQVGIIYVQRKMVRNLEREGAEEMGVSLIHKLVHLPASFFAQRKGGDITQSIQAIDRLAELFSGALCLGVFAAIQLIIYLGLMIYYSPLLSAIACLIALFNGCFFYFSKKHRHQVSAIAKQELVNLNSLTISCMSMILQIKIVGQAHFFSQWQKQLNQYLNAQHQLSFVNNIIQCISLLILGIANVVTLGIGGWVALNHSLSIGGLIAFNVLFLSFNELIFQFVSFGSQLNLAKVDMQRVNDVMQYSVGQTKKIPPTANFRGKIEIIDLTFGYSRSAKPLFNHLNLTIEPHAKIAITGPSGSGKSTLANLIAGLYSPWSGLILIDGIPLATIPAEKRTSLITLSSQEQFFFKGTIKENLCMWDKEYTDIELLHALRMACIDELLQNTDLGLNFQLAEGASNLSGGQRQRLEIARSVLRNPKILIFDEATCALDSVVEEQIKQQIFKYQHTTLWIAHRLSTIRNVDKIFILKDGKLVDSGSHQMLLHQNSIHYQDLFKIDSPKEVATCSE